ncbi:MAG: hypothetical protein LUD72_01585 [Bacteroidales bacterium]|nr:hypothetical protein [Bacteroidales bacterium]
MIKTSGIMSNRFLVLTRGEDNGIIPEWSVASFHESLEDKVLYIIYREEGNVVDSPIPFVEDYLVAHITSMPGVSSPQGKNLTVLCSWLGSDGKTLRECLYGGVTVRNVTPGHLDYSRDERYTIATEMKYATKKINYPNAEEE